VGIVTGRAFVGVSGFSYPGWKGRFYPKELKSDELLGYYSRRLNSVEINSSFYASPGAAMVKGWSSKTGAGFKFAFKGPRQITHILKLGKGASEAAERMSQVLGLLGPRRGPVLFQLPPYLRQDLALLDTFLTETRGIEDRVFEFRHESWLGKPTYQLLERHGAGFCIAETEEMKPEFQVTGGLAYLRLRKESYDGKSIDQWADKISKLAEGARECYAYLRHDETGENGVLAKRLADKIAGK
jgi:uncharacterized protein YecE (DUF72 family)